MLLSGRVSDLFTRRRPSMFAAERYGAGHSPLGGSPPKDMSLAPAVPAAPNVASRTKPGVVPMKRGR